MEQFERSSSERKREEDDYYDENQNFGNDIGFGQPHNKSVFELKSSKTASGERYYRRN